MTQLYFPKLTFVEERISDKKSHWRDGNILTIYKLDWTGFHNLPEPYNTEVDQLEFEIDGSYLTEMQRNQERASIEWAHPRPFDTIIRENCLAPAIAHVQTFFELLWDCHFYVRITNNLDNKFWLSNAMIYRMWMGQTGSACVARNAKLEILADIAKDRFERYLQNNYLVAGKSLSKEEVQEMLIPGQLTEQYTQNIIEAARNWLKGRDEYLEEATGCRVFCNVLNNHREKQRDQYKRLKIQETYISPFTGQLQ